MQKVKIFSLSLIALFLMLFSFVIFPAKVYAESVPGSGGSGGGGVPDWYNSDGVTFVKDGSNYYVHIDISKDNYEVSTNVETHVISFSLTGIGSATFRFILPETTTSCLAWFNGRNTSPDFYQSGNNMLSSDGSYIDVYYEIVLFGDSQYDIMRTSSKNIDKRDENIQQLKIMYTVSDTKPVYSGETAFVTNVDDPMSIDDILSHIRLIDEEDGDVTESIEIVLDEYTSNMNVLGTHEIQIKGHDSKNNYAYLTIYVLVKDVSEPVISGQVNYNQSYANKLNVSTILNGLSVVDNYDDDLEIVIESDNYSSNYNSIGKYQILFSATDSSGNKGLFTVNINVVDDVAPVFTGPTSILKGQTEILTVDDINSQLVANDFIDGQVAITVKSDNYTGHGNKVGKYTIVFQAQDSSGNVGTHTVEITVSDNIPPIFYVDNYFITVEQSLTLTREDIIAILQASGQLNVQSSTNVQFLLNEYEGNESVVGIYAVSLKASSADGSGKIFNLAVQVVEDEGGTVVHPEDPWYKQFGSWFVKAWDWLKEPVKDNSWVRWGYIVGLGAIVIILGFVRAVSAGGRRYRRRW